MKTRVTELSEKEFPGALIAGEQSKAGYHQILQHFARGNFHSLCLLKADAVTVVFLNMSRGVNRASRSPVKASSPKITYQRPKSGLVFIIIGPASYLPEQHANSASTLF